VGGLVGSVIENGVGECDPHRPDQNESKNQQPSALPQEIFYLR
jgi:hypothetical protein